MKQNSNLLDETNLDFAFGSARLFASITAENLVRFFVSFLLLLLSEERVPKHVPSRRGSWPQCITRSLTPAPTCESHAPLAQWSLGATFSAEILLAAANPNAAAKHIDSIGSLSVR